MHIKYLFQKVSIKQRNFELFCLGFYKLIKKKWQSRYVKRQYLFNKCLLLTIKTDIYTKKYFCGFKIFESYDVENTNNKLISNTKYMDLLYLKSELLKYPEFFDEEYYVLNYPESRTSSLNALDHYFYKGWKIGYNPSTIFSTIEYLKNNRTKINPLLHYFKYGRKRGLYCCFNNVFSPAEKEINDY